MIMLQSHAHTGRRPPGTDEHHVDDAEGSIGDLDGQAHSQDEQRDEGYRLVSVDATRAPDGCTGGNWFVYRIVQGRNGIKGYRQGTIERVCDDVRSIVSALNGRRATIKPPLKPYRRAATTPDQERPK